VGVYQRVVQAGPFGAALDFKQLSTVLHEDSDVVAAPQPGIAQEAGDPVAPRLELGEGDRFG